MAWFDAYSGNPGGGSGAPLDLTGGLLGPNADGATPPSNSLGAPGGVSDGLSFTSSGLGGVSNALGGAAGSAASGGGGGLNANWLTSLAGPVAAGGALAYNLFKGDQTDPNITSLQNLVQTLGPEQAQLFSQGNQYMSYLASGTLPPGMQAEVDQATKAGKARFLQNAASSGLGADPNKNSALAQDLNSLDQQAKAHQAQMATQLLSAGNQMIGQGISISNLDANIFKYLADYDMKQSQATGNAITNFASALGGFAMKAGPLLLL